MPKFAKGSQEAKEWGAKMKKAREERAKDPNRPPRKKRVSKAGEQVLVPMVGADELILPEYMASQKTTISKGGVSRTQIKLVNPLTKERNLASRQGKPVVLLSRRPVADSELVSEGLAPVPIKAFSKADRATIRQQFLAIEANKGIDTQLRPKIGMPPAIARGRPQILSANVEYWARMPRAQYEASRPMIMWSQPELLPIIDRIRQFRMGEGDEEAEDDYGDDDEGGDEGGDEDEDEDEEPKPKGKKGRKPKEDYSNLVLGFDRSGKQRTIKQELAHLRRQKRIAKEYADAGKKAPVQYNPKKARQAKENITMQITEKKQGKGIRGEGILEDLRNTFSSASKSVTRVVKKGAEAVKDKYEDAKDFAKVVISGRSDYQPQGREILRKYGAEKIKAIELGREPVMAVLKGVLSFLSGGEFAKRVDKSFDDLFHLFCVITLESGKKIMTEKNEVIIISEGIPARGEKAQYKMVSDIPYYDTDPITLQEVFDNARKSMGDKRWFSYSAKDNNCQDYLLSILKSSDIGNQADYEFIKQDTKSLFRDLPYLRKFANSVTGFAGKLDVILNGRGLDLNKEPDSDIPESETDAIEQDDPLIYGEGLIGKDYEIQSVVFSKGKWSVASAIKWLKENKHKSPKVDVTDNFLRFRQIEPSELDKMDYKEYRTKKLGDSGIELVIAYKNKISGKGIRMCDRCEMCGGKLTLKSIGDAFKKVGKKIDRGFKKEIINPTEKLANVAGKYITQKKGGLATDLIDYGIPALTAGVLGGVAGATTGGLGGVAGSAIGSKIGKEYIAPALHKATGAGVGGGRNAWITLVKKVAKDRGITYKEAMSVASQMRR